VITVNPLSAAHEIRSLVVDDISTGENIIDDPYIVEWLGNK